MGTTGGKKKPSTHPTPVLRSAALLLHVRFTQVSVFSLHVWPQSHVLGAGVDLAGLGSGPKQGAGGAANALACASLVPAVCMELVCSSSVQHRLYL
jgi:hypothetical protein